MTALVYNYSNHLSFSPPCLPTQGLLARPCKRSCGQELAKGHETKAATLRTVPEKEREKYHRMCTLTHTNTNTRTTARTSSYVRVWHCCCKVRLCVCVRSQVEEPFVRLECTCVHTPSLDHSISVWKHLRLARPERTRGWFVCCAVIKYPCEEGLSWPATSDCCSSYCWGLHTYAGKVGPPNRQVDYPVWHNLEGCPWIDDHVTTQLACTRASSFSDVLSFLLSGFVECTQFLVL